MLGKTTRGALALGAGDGLLQNAGDMELLGMLIAALTDQSVIGQRQLARLQPFLQPGLGIFFCLANRQCRQRGFEPRQHHRTATLETAVQVDGRDNRFDSIGQDRIAPMTTGLQLTWTQREALAEVQRTSDHCQRAFAYEFGPRAGQCAFIGLGPTLIQRLGDQQIDDAVAEKFQPLVVRRPGAAMPQRLGEQIRIGKCMPDRITALKILFDTALRQILCRIELANHIQIANQLAADFVVDFHPPAAFDPLELDVSFFDVF